jgi:CBS domain containing-hemolysin-like protein
MQRAKRAVALHSANDFRLEHCPMPARPRLIAALLLIPALLAPGLARAAFLSGDALDTAADWLAIIVLFVVPAVVIVVFWLIHILPEKIAEKRHHPQKAAINTLCLLSLFFGGILWPLAWIWAYTRPVAYRMAYGTDKHEDYFVERGARAKEGGLLAAEIDHLRRELDDMAARGRLPEELATLRADLDALHAAKEPEAGAA